MQINIPISNRFGILVFIFLLCYRPWGWRKKKRNAKCNEGCSLFLFLIFFFVRYLKIHFWKSSKILVIFFVFFESKKVSVLNLSKISRESYPVKFPMTDISESRTHSFFFSSVLYSYYYLFVTGFSSYCFETEHAANILKTSGKTDILIPVYNFSNVNWV